MKRWIQAFRDLDFSKEAIVVIAILCLDLIALLAAAALIELRFAGSDRRQAIFSEQLHNLRDDNEALKRQMGDTWQGPRRRAWLTKLKIANPGLVVPEPDEQ